MIASTVIMTLASTTRIITIQPDTATV